MRLMRLQLEFGLGKRLRFRRLLRLQQPVQGELVVFFLISLPVSVGAKVSAASPPFEEGQLLTAVQTPHVALIDPFISMLKSSLTAFHAVKHLSPGFEVKTLGGVR